MDERADRQARLKAQFDQVQADGIVLVDDPGVLASMVDLTKALENATRTFIEAGFPQELLWAVLLPTVVETILAARDEESPHD